MVTSLRSRKTEFKPVVELKKDESGRLFLSKTHYMINTPMNKPGYKASVRKFPEGK